MEMYNLATTTETLIDIDKDLLLNNYHIMAGVAEGDIVYEEKKEIESNLYISNIYNFLEKFVNCFYLFIVYLILVIVVLIYFCLLLSNGAFEIHSSEDLLNFFLFNSRLLIRIW